MASARSTDWLVEAKTDGTSVFVVLGRVEVAKAGEAGGPILEASYGTDVPRGGRPTDVKRWSLTRVQDALARTRVR